MGLQGGTARCYDWWMDYLKVRNEVSIYMLPTSVFDISSWSTVWIAVPRREQGSDGQYKEAGVQGMARGLQ